MKKAPKGKESKKNGGIIMSYTAYTIPKSLKTQKWKKPSRDAENDYGEENEVFLKLIFTAN